MVRTENLVSCRPAEPNKIDVIIQFMWILIVHHDAGGSDCQVIITIIRQWTLLQCFRTKIETSVGVGRSQIILQKS